VTPPLILASASISRQVILQAAGIRFLVEPSGAEETVFEAPTSEVVAALASQKAAEVASRHKDDLVLGCDSLLEIEGRIYGKPSSPEDAVERWLAQRGKEGTLFTGHELIASATDDRHSEVVATRVRFGLPSEAEIRAYVATGEPLDKAGSFTIEGRSAPFIDRVEGDPGNVRGLSLPALARLLAAHGFSITEFWIGEEEMRPEPSGGV
jgi:septum formation protein